MRSEEIATADKKHNCWWRSLNNLEAKREGVRVAREDLENALDIQAATKFLNGGSWLARQAATSPAVKVARGSSDKRSAFAEERRAAVSVLEFEPEERS